MSAMPHGGSLVNLRVSAKQAARWRARLKSLPTLSLSRRSLADLEMLAVGGFSPLRGFMGKADYSSVIGQMHLANGLVWTIPVTLAVTREESIRFKEGR